MKHNFEEISPVKKKLQVEIDPDEVEKKLDQAYKELGKRAKIPGFRPGKIPRKLLESRYGAQVEDDVARELINETFPKALEDSQIFPLGTPLLEKDALTQGQPFKYSAVMEIQPEFEVQDYLGIELKKETLSVTEEDVERELQRIRESNGRLSSVEEDRATQKNDYVLIDYEGFEDGQALEDVNASDYLLQLGSSDFHLTFEEALTGLKKGDEANIAVAFEEDYFHSRLAGRQIDFTVKVKDIKELVLPELDDEFAANLGEQFAGLEDLRNKVREALTSREQDRIDKELKQRLVGRIADGVDIELPEILVTKEIDYAVENIKQNLMRSGSSLEKQGLSEEKLRKDFTPDAENRVKEMLVLGQIARQEEITVDEGDVEEGYRKIAERMGQDPETIRQYYEARNMVESLKENLAEEKTLNYLLEHAKIKEIDKNALEEGTEKETKE